ncbi:MAG: UDP-N-acetylmuramoyl-tripeptide--D-alanyl-D-alanine ligase [Candidatus Kapaibacterium sp.]|jgi:UDP-N-acetylmuramoyl-tripeptide--D-alanyl-D-alanine ligase
MKNTATFTLLELKSALTAIDFINFENEINVSGVSTDTRTLEKNNIFIALKGEVFDGHDSLADAFKKEASAVIISENWFKNHKNNIDFPAIVVKDTLKALAELAFFHRIRFNFPVIAVAGSNGKTSTKELIASVLSQRYKVLKTYKNFNNQIGVPLTMLQFDSTHQAAVVEIGTNSPGEISLLSELLKPDLGVITNIGKEHLEQLIDLEQVEIEETFLFGNLMKTGGVCFINCDDQRLAKYKNILKNSITYGTDKSQKNDFNVEIELKNDLKPSLSFNINDENFVANLNAVGYAIALNATAAIPIGAYLGLTGSEIKVGLEAYKENSTEQSYARMALQNIGKFLFLNDCYNANPDSMLMSIKTLLAYKQAKKHIAILGDMFELGEATEEEHSNVLENASNSLYKVLVTGKNMEQTAQKNKRNNVIYFGTLEEIANYIKKLDDIENTVFLLKGSRGMKMENIFLYL